jgi:hypothetical protein
MNNHTSMIGHTSRFTDHQFYTDGLDSLRRSLGRELEPEDIETFIDYAGIRVRQHSLGQFSDIFEAVGISQQNCTVTPENRGRGPSLGRIALSDTLETINVFGVTCVPYDCYGGFVDPAESEVIYLCSDGHAGYWVDCWIINWYLDYEFGCAHGPISRQDDL